MMDLNSEVRAFWTKWWLLVMLMVMTVVMEVMGLSGDNVCMVKQKYNITKRVKYRAPMNVRTYVWCFSMPPRCSKWSTEMRDLTRLETEERTAEVAVCCPGYKMKDVSCVPICPNGKTGHDCTINCPIDKWGPNCVHDCKRCIHGKCSPITGECHCPTGWQGERCEIFIQTTTVADVMDELLTTNKITPKLVIKPSAKTTTSASAIGTSIATTTSSKLSTISAIVTGRSTTTTKHISNLKSKTEMFDSSEIRRNAATTSSKVAVTQVNPTEVLTSTVPMTSYSKSMSTLTVETTVVFKNTTTESSFIKETKNVYQNQFMYNRTDIPTTQIKLSSSPIEKTTPINELSTPNTISSVVLITKDPQTTKNMEQEMTRKLDTSTTQTPSNKFKIKEIWIKPAQKGDATVEYKTKEDVQLRQKAFNKKEQSSTHTTPRTIVVSIIPTSSYSSFKKIALSTTSYVSKSYNKIFEHHGTNHSNLTASTSPVTTYVPVRNFTSFKVNRLNETMKPILLSTKSPLLLAITRSAPMSMTANSTPIDNNIQFSTNNTIARPTKEPHLKTIEPVTNSMSSSLTGVINKSSQLTTAPAIMLISPSTATSLVKAKSDVTEIKIFEFPSVARSTKHSLIDNSNKTEHNELESKTTLSEKTTNASKQNETGTNTIYKTVTTVVPESNEEKFHILTEPEPITDVMGDKVSGRTSVDLTSVISIAGGVMMVVISLAILLVMMERRKKPRYDEIRKMDEMRMQVYLDENNVPPPPYVRSIFHTPLPDPPISEKCHYQPISTLDRNIKQFMRPVVVQTISPLMLENFRGILECHYDHLPLRNSLPVSSDSRLAPSMEECHELLCTRAHSITETTIEALKCEAKEDVIDTTTSEPLYAEIPCWRPPSEHAVEVLNLSGEAVTEL